MSVSTTRSLLCWTLLVILPQSLLGQTPSAILHTQGGVWVNGYEAKDSTAIFAGDVLETKAQFSGQLTVDGASVVIQPESVAKFQGDFLELDHGSVSVGTSKSFKVRVNCLTVVPVMNEWSQYDVTDVNGTVQVAAHKSDVNVDVAAGHRRSSANKPSAEPPAAENSPGSSNASVHQGEQHNYNESDLCGVPARPTGAANGLNPKWIAVGGAGAGVLIWVLIHGGGTTTPMSASAP